MARTLCRCRSYAPRLFWTARAGERDSLFAESRKAAGAGLVRGVGLVPADRRQLPGERDRSSAVMLLISGQVGAGRPRLIPYP
jgi:hypothetical protein